MKGKAVVIAGGAGGLGLATVAMMAGRGARIAIIDRDAEALENAIGNLRRSGAEAVGVLGDITTRRGAVAAFEQAVETFGRIGSMVNCAGIYPRKPILEITDEDWDDSFTVNVRGTHNMMVAAVKHMRPRRDAGS